MVADDIRRERLQMQDAKDRLPFNGRHRIGIEEMGRRLNQTAHRNAISESIIDLENQREGQVQSRSKEEEPVTPNRRENLGHQSKELRMADTPKGAAVNDSTFSPSSSLSRR
jgi:hypothetical protein